MLPSCCCCCCSGLYIKQSVAASADMILGLSMGVVRLRRLDWVFIVIILATIIGAVKKSSSIPALLAVAVEQCVFLCY